MIELDQRLNAAFTLAQAMTSGHKIRDEHVFVALYRLNTFVTRNLDLDLDRIQKIYLPAGIETDFKARGRIGRSLDDRAIDHVLEELMADPAKTTIGVGDYVRTLVERSDRYADNYARRPYTADLLAQYFGAAAESPLSSLPEVRKLLTALGETGPTEDFAYLLSLDGDRIVFRVTSVLDDYIQINDRGILTPQRALLTHFSDAFGGFTEDEISELEDLLNRNPLERDLQAFFEQHPHFLRQFDYREVYSHVYLRHRDKVMMPDFILTDCELQKAAIWELKLPGPKLVRRQKNRDRFAAIMQEARTQLLRYRDWFRNKRNRRSLVKEVGMEIYEPQMAVVMGRSHEFRDAVDRQRLRADNPDVTVVTFDDILMLARRRRLAIRPM